jgi:hypothetical protein
LRYYSLYYAKFTQGGFVGVGGAGKWIAILGFLLENSRSVVPCRGGTLAKLTSRKKLTMLKQNLTKLIAVATIAAASAAITAGCGAGEGETGATPEPDEVTAPPEDGSGDPGTEEMPGKEGTPNPTG